MSLAIALMLVAAAPPAPQGPKIIDDVRVNDEAIRPAPSSQAITEGRVATSSVERVGERRQRQLNADGIDPMARINVRIPNRVQNRLRTRIDKAYDPLTNVTRPFEAAEDSTRARRR